MLPRLAISLLFLLGTLSGTNARPGQRRPSPSEADTLDLPCRSNSECLQRGLPLLAPRVGRQRNRRQTQDFVPVSTTTCGTAETVFLTPGEYQLSLAGARGGQNARAGTANNLGGLGAAFTATFNVVNNITVGYFVGCLGASFSFVGAGGGGSFVYLIGANQNALLVAGGGGGGGFAENNPGRPAGTSFSGIATNADGTIGAFGGSGGGVFPGDAPGFRAGGGGGGFQSPGSGATSDAGPTTGGRQSINYGGDFGGGSSTNMNGAVVTGGAGGGGGAGFNGGGGGGGFSGGGAGRGGGEVGGNGGGGGGASYYASGTPGGALRIQPLTLTATSAGMGSFVITRVGG